MNSLPVANNIATRETSILKLNMQFFWVRYFLLLLLLFSLSNAQQVDIPFEHLTTNNGLSINTVSKILQDSRGFIWVATNYGLNRYDGYNFKVFLPIHSDSSSISNPIINSICEDKAGNIWAATQDGLNKYDWKKEKFYRYKNDPKNPYSISNNLVYCVYEDKNGTIWCGTLNGLNRFNREKNNFEIITKVSDQLNQEDMNSVTGITENYEGDLWLGTWNGMTCISKSGEIKKQLFNQQVGAARFEYRQTSVLFEDSANNLWIGTNGRGLKLYNQHTGLITEFTSSHNPNTISSNYISDIFEDSHKNIWIGTFYGLNKYDPVKKSFTQYFSNSEKTSTLLSNGISSIFEDRSGLMWIGTTAGISYFNQPLNNFEYYQENFQQPDKGLISGSVITAFVDKQDNIWVGTMDGLDKILRTREKIIHFTNNPGNPNSISNNFIRSVFVDSEGIVWIGTNNDGLNRYDPKTNRFQLFYTNIKDTNTISNKGITSICEDKSGILWFGTWWGLNSFDRNTGKFTRYFSNTSKSTSLKNDQIWDVFVDSQGTLWVGTNGGLSKFIPETKSFVNFTSDSTNKNYVSDNRVYTIFESSDHIMWFGTINGLNSYDRSTGKTIVYDQNSGLPGDYINGIQEDNNGYLWIGTDKGLSKFDRKNGKFINLDNRNGLNGLEFLQNVAEKSSDGQLYFGQHGLMHFYPDKIHIEKLNAPVVFTDLKIYNQSVNVSDKSVLNEAIAATKSIRIPPDKDVITLEFALLDYLDSRNNSFRYKLKGFDESWNEVGTRNTATYTNLPPGEYTFFVRATNNNGFRNEQEASLQIYILPIFYETWWFKILFIFAILISIFMYIDFRTKKISRQNKILEERVSVRTQDLDRTIDELSTEIVERKKAEERAQASLEEKEVLLKEIHHRVKNNLQVISSLLYLQSLSIEDQDTINLFEDSQNRIKSMALIHEKLYQSMDFAEIDFKDYIRSLLDNLIRSYNKNKNTIQTELLADNIKLSLDTAISCGLIANELITNSFKYAYPPEWLKLQSENFEMKISIQINKYENNTYLLKIKDNGIGIPQDLDIENIDSLGLKLVNSMVTQLNGSVKIGRTNGTEFIIEFTDIV